MQQAWTCHRAASTWLSFAAMSSKSKRPLHPHQPAPSTSKPSTHPVLALPAAAVCAGHADLIAGLATLAVAALRRAGLATGRALCCDRTRAAAAAARTAAGRINAAPAATSASMAGAATGVATEEGALAPFLAVAVAQLVAGWQLDEGLGAAALLHSEPCPL